MGPGMRHAHQRLTAAIMTLNGLKDGSQRTGGHQDAATRPHRILLATFCGLIAPKQYDLVHPLSVESLRPGEGPAEALSPQLQSIDGILEITSCHLTTIPSHLVPIPCHAMDDLQRARGDVETPVHCQTSGKPLARAPRPERGRRAGLAGLGAGLWVWDL